MQGATQDLLKCLFMALLLIIVFTHAQDHIRIGIDLQQERCLKGSPWLFVILKGSLKLKRGDLVAFQSDRRMQSHYPVGTHFIKRIEAIHTEASSSLQYWVVGDHPKSYDSRTFGAIDEAQLIGKAYALF